MRLYYFAILSLSLYSCTKETYIENQLPEKNLSELNKSFSVTEPGNTCQLRISGKDYPLSVMMERVKVSPAYWPAPQVAIGDSIMFVSLFSESIHLETAQGSLRKFAKGDVLPEASNSYLSSFDLWAAYRKIPFTGNYTAFTFLTGTTYNFSNHDSGYLAFSMTAGNKPVFGWIEIMINDPVITFKRFGYQAFEGATAGE